MLRFVSASARTSFFAVLALVVLSPLAALAGTPVDVKIPEMHCGACVKSVREELSKVPGIEKDSIDVMLEGKHATLTLKNNDAKSIDAVKAAIAKAGYTKDVKVDVVTPGTKAAEKKN